jgi:hypothetical protein
MLLRNNKVLKFFAILLFSFELFAPAFLSTGQDDSTDSLTKITLSTSHTNICAFLAIEEINEEGREGKDLVPIALGILSVQLLSSNASSISYLIAAPSGQDQFETHPPLFTLHRALRI